MNKFNATSELHIRRDGKKEVYFTDNNGQVRVVIDDDDVIKKYDYKPFGELYWSSDGSHLREGLEGSIFDPESELQMKGVRMYDTETGRFTTPDLLWAAFPSHTPYHYAYNSPMIWSDPSGLAPEKERDREKLMGGEESGPIYSNPLMPKFQLELNAIHALQLKWMGQSNNDFIAKYQSDDKDATRLAEWQGEWNKLTSLPVQINGTLNEKNDWISSKFNINSNNFQNDRFTLYVEEAYSNSNSIKNEVVKSHFSAIPEIHNWSDMVLSTLNQFNAINRIGIDKVSGRVYANSLFSDRNPYFGYRIDRSNVRLLGPILRNTGYIMLATGLIIEADDYFQGNQSLIGLGADVSAMIYAARLGGWTGILFGLTYSIGSNELNREPIFGWNSGSRFLSPSDNTNVFINWRK